MAHPRTEVLGFEAATAGDEVFRQLVLARIIEPTGKQDSLRVAGRGGYRDAQHGTDAYVGGPIPHSRPCPRPV
jgi:hypothetical protein